MPPANNSHSSLGASKAHRWMNCPGSVRMTRDIPETRSTYAEEGTAAHYLAETCLRKELDAAAYADRVVRILDKGCSILKPGAVAMEGDFEVDAEMIEAVQIYLDAVRSDMAATPGAELEIEKKFDLSKLRAGMFGTNDACLKQPFGFLRIYDLKYGAGYAVEVEKNPQLLYYALGAYLGGDYEIVELIVIQPRARHKDGPVRRWGLDAEALEKWATEELIPAAERAEAPDAPVVPGHWCKFCAAMGVCRGLMDFAAETTKADFTKVVELPPPDLLSETDLSKVMASADIFRSWLTSVFAHAENKLRQGGTVPGWKLVQKKTNRVWRDEKEVVQALFKFRDKIFEKKLFSPAKMEKFIKESGIAVDVAKLTMKPEGGVAIAPESDRRPAVEMNPAADFAVIEEIIEF
jgi:hypothetical protein